MLPEATKIVGRPCVTGALYNVRWRKKSAYEAVQQEVFIKGHGTSPSPVTSFLR